MSAIVSATVAATMITKVGPYIEDARCIQLLFFGKKSAEPTWENTFDASFTMPTDNAVLSFALVNSISAPATVIITMQ